MKKIVIFILTILTSCTICHAQKGVTYKKDSLSYGIGPDGITYETDSLKVSVELMKLDTDSDGVNELFLVISTNNIHNPDSNNLLVLSPKGTLIIGEDAPCLIVGGNLKLSVKGEIKADNAFNIIPLSTSTNNKNNTLNADYEHMRKVLMEVNVYSDINGELILNHKELENAIPKGVRKIKHDGIEKDFFDNSQLFYHLIGTVHSLNLQQSKQNKQLQLKENQIQSQANKIKQLEAQLKTEKQKNSQQDNRLTALENLINKQADHSSTQKQQRKQPALQQQITIYPNPSSNILNIKLSDKLIGKQGIIIITDLSGKSLLSQPINNQTLIPVNLQQLDLATGAYFCKVLIDGELITTKKIRYIK